ncbi:MAG: MBL fold metallo-hydrolase [Nitrospinota bacterium]|nr:MBL fold metallo-hydrolase [Nitrospinota bacterium]
MSKMKKHHVENGFVNIHNNYKLPGFSDMVKWQWERIGMENPNDIEYNFPMGENDPEFLRQNRTKNTVTWIGQATLLLQIGGKNILTDPIFSERASPFENIGPKRHTKPGLALEDLPPIDIVVISHNHYDHLDTKSLMALRKRDGGDKTVFMVPLGLREWFDDTNITNVIERDWWEETEFDDVKVVSVPVQHWSRRSMFSTNDTLWCGWVVVSPGFRFVFLGDTGYTPHFREIAEKYGPFDLAAIPIGAYEPRWFMKFSHINPEESVKAHIDLNAKRSVAMHWGTFVLTNEPLDEPPLKLKEEREKAGLSEEEFFILRHGDSRVMSEPDK